MFFKNPFTAMQRQLAKIEHMISQNNALIAASRVEPFTERYKALIGQQVLIVDSAVTPPQSITGILVEVRTSDAFLESIGKQTHHDTFIANVGDGDYRCVVYNKSINCLRI